MGIPIIGELRDGLERLEVNGVVRLVLGNPLSPL